MATYAIGDIQGCYRELRRLLDRIDFRPGRDRLWFAGDLVNRGPGSLEVLRFVKDLGDSAVTVLGNHDLHLLAVWQNKHRHLKSNDTLRPILTASDRDELLHWLRCCPLMHDDPDLGYTLIHAGLPPQWDRETALRCAGEVEDILQGPEFLGFLDHMYGNEPARWSPQLSGWARLRFSVNCFTRLRFCTADGTLDFREKGEPGRQTAPLIPWFEVPGRRSAQMRVIFGHWSALGLYRGDGVYGIDTGCLWGGRLTALRLDGGEEAISEECGGILM